MRRLWNALLTWLGRKPAPEPPGLSPQRKADLRRMAIGTMTEGTPMLAQTDEDVAYLIRLSLGME